MLETIGLFDGLIKPADLEAIVKAEKLFNNAGYYHHEYPCTEVLAIKDFENDEKAAQIYKIYFENLDSAIMMFGVKVNREEIDLPEMVEIFDALLSLDDPEQKDVIGETIDSDESDASLILATILSEFTEMDAMQIMLKLESVDDTLIGALKKITANPDLVGDVMFLTMKIREDYLAFTGEVKEGPVREYIKNVQELPLSFDATLEFLHEELSKIYDPETLSFELISLGILSNIDKDEMVSKLSAEAWDLNQDRYHEVELHISQKYEEFLDDE